jgi:hypothetical protein
MGGIGVILERPTGDELTGVLSLGLLAESAVMALGRAIRSEPLRDEDVRALEQAQQLFALMATQDVVVVDAFDNTMLTDESYLDAVRVVELREDDGELQERAARYVELIRSALDGDVAGIEDELANLRELFAAVGEATLTRANEISRASQESSWRPAHQLISRF